MPSCRSPSTLARAHARSVRVARDWGVPLGARRTGLFHRLTGSYAARMHRCVVASPYHDRPRTLRQMAGKMATGLDKMADTTAVRLDPIVGSAEADRIALPARLLSSYRPESIAYPSSGG